MALHYYTRPDGVATVDNDDFTPPVGWTEVSLASYNTALAAVDAANLARQNSDAAAECAAKKSVYNDLIAASIPDATAHALSGWHHGDC